MGSVRLATAPRCVGGRASGHRDATAWKRSRPGRAGRRRGPGPCRPSPPASSGDSIFFVDALTNRVPCASQRSPSQIGDGRPPVTRSRGRMVPRLPPPTPSARTPPTGSAGRGHHANLLVEHKRKDHHLRHGSVTARAGRGSSPLATLGGRRHRRRRAHRRDHHPGLPRSVKTVHRYLQPRAFLGTDPAGQRQGTAADRLTSRSSPSSDPKVRRTRCRPDGLDQAAFPSRSWMCGGRAPGNLIRRAGQAGDNGRCRSAGCLRDGRPNRGSKNGVNGAKNTGSSNSTSTRASSSGSRRTSSGSTASHRLTSSARVRSIWPRFPAHRPTKGHSPVHSTMITGGTPTHLSRSAARQGATSSGRSS